MAINLGKLELDLAQIIKTLSSSSDRLVAAKILTKLRQGSVTVVGSVSKLPSATSVEDGALYFVEADGQLYVAQQALKSWKPLTANYFGAVWAWGRNGQGRLGDNTVINKSSPVSVVGGFTDWCQVSAGGSHAVAIRINGDLWSWGGNSQGKLGDNTTVSKSSPVSVVGGFTDWCQVSVGSSHSVAIRTNGTLWGWGYNYSGRLGDNTIANKSSPVSVVGGFTDWCQVSSGGGHSTAIRTNGTLWAWGSNYCGILGDSTTSDKSSPVSVVGGFTDWCQVSAGISHTAAVRTNGTAWTWGRNLNGILGDNTTINKSSPVSVVGGFTDWCQVSSGFCHSVAIRTNGTIWSWGCGNSGQLGDNTTVAKSSPVSVVGGFTDWCHVDAGWYHTAAVRTNGTAWTWGCNLWGQLGDNTTVAKSSPVSVVGGIISWKSLSASADQTLALQTKTF